MRLIIILLVITRTSVAQDRRSMKMSIMVGCQFECVNTTCLPFLTVGVSNIRRCQMACLAQDQCEAASFQQSSSSCQLFSNSPNQGGNLTSAMGTTTMIVKSETQIPSVPTTSISNDTSLWSFNNNTLDSLLGYDGVGINSTTYRTPGINGYGSALSVSQSLGQYVSVSRYPNITYRSFTIEMWFYATNLSSASYGLFGQHYNKTRDQSLQCMIKNNATFFGFYGDDLSGSIVIQTNKWYHVAFVFDSSSLTKQIYVNGILDRSIPSSYYHGLNGSIVIGKVEYNLGSPYYFSGYIDEVSLAMHAKQSNEILNDATLVTWNSFDNLPYSDSGPLTLTVTTGNLTSVSGRVNQAVRFNSNSSYYQMNGFVLLGVSNYSYSIALWTRPSSIRGSILIHLSERTNGKGWCADLLGFSSTGQIVVTGWGPPANFEILGPVLPDNVWTHIVATYSLTNGLRLYVNGIYYNSSSNFAYVASDKVNILTLGNPLQGIQKSDNGTCSSQSIVPSVYNGFIDEFRVYSRELNSDDVSTLANP